MLRLLLFRFDDNEIIIFDIKKKKMVGVKIMSYDALQCKGFV